MAFTIFLLLMLISAKLSSGENDYMTAIARDGVQRALLPTKAVLPAEEAKNATTCNIDRLLLDIVTRQEKKASEELNKCFETLLNGTSAKCHGQWMQLMRRVEASHGNDTNGTRFFDATGKPRPGILRGDIYWYGSYAECIIDLHGSSHHHGLFMANNNGMRNNSNSTSHIDFSGRYCLAKLPLSGLKPPTSPPPPKNNASGHGGFGPSQSGLFALQWGWCVPSGCHEADVRRMVHNAEQQVKPRKNATMPPVQVECLARSDESTLDGIAVWTICVFSFLLAIGLVAAAFDVYLSIIDGDRSESAPFSHRLLVALSFVESWRKIFAPVVSQKDAQGRRQLSSVHGMRVLAMLWVICGHSYLMTVVLVVDPLTFLDANKQLLFQIIMNGTISVDVFFMLSGALVTYLFVDALESGNRAVIGTGQFWLRYYLHRYWRLTPVYMAVLFLLAGLGPYLVSGPHEDLLAVVTPGRCQSSWWTNALYVNNLVNSQVSNMCLAWTWYLANDMQFYVFAPLLLVPLWRFGLRPTVALWLLFFAAYAALTAHLTVAYHLPATMADIAALLHNDSGVANYFPIYYIKPWCRVGAYLVGMAVGYALRKWRNCRLSPAIVGACWTASIGAICAVTFAFYREANGDVYPEWSSALYNVVARPLWALAIGWILFACETGRGGVVDRLLSHKALIPLSRLTYTAYLTHPAAILLVASNFGSPLNWSHSTVLTLFLGFGVFSYLTALIVSALFEGTAMSLERLLLGEMAKRKRIVKQQ